MEIKNRYIILGASRGLGLALYKTLKAEQPKAEFLLSARKIEGLFKSSNTQEINQDFTQLSDEVKRHHFFNQLQSFNPTHIIYCAGGGPYGLYQDKNWRDHEWAIKLNFIFPAQLIHFVASQSGGSSQFSLWPSLKQIACIGSAIAESKPDPKAASYAAGKHALRGLITTLQEENSIPFSVRLYSPGYIETDLLPINSHPRLNQLAEKPEITAQKIIAFMDSELVLNYK